MEYHFKYYKDKPKGYWGECVEIDYCHDQGDTLDDLKKNLQVALDFCLDEPENSKLIIPLPKKSVRGVNILKIKVSSTTAFAMLMRQYRLSQGYTQRQTAKILGKELISYQRLEKSKTANPTLKTLSLIKDKFPDLNIEAALA